jgi:hypothetical protein
MSGPTVHHHGASRWEPDLSALLLRLAKRLEDDGVEHPVEAAVALTVRGRRGVTRAQLADELDIDEAELARAESGASRVWDWPRSLWRLIEEDVPDFATLLHPARSHPASTASRHWGSLA